MTDSQDATPTAGADAARDGAEPTAGLATSLLADAFTRVAEDLPALLEGLGPEEVLWQPDPEANSIGWLVWHLTRVQDDHLAGVGGGEQVWLSDGWADRFGLAYPQGSIGYGQTAADVRAFDVSDTGLLLGYHRATHVRTLEVLAGLTPGDYERIVDERWDPPVTAAVRLVSVVNDITQHAGQVGYLRGLVARRAR